MSGPKSYAYAQNEALLIVDMINDFVLEGAPLEVPDARKIIPFIRERAEWFNSRKNPIMYICDYHQRDDKEFFEYPPHALGGSLGACVVEELNLNAIWNGNIACGDYKIRKSSFSGFFETDLDKMLQLERVETVYITGVLTSVCVFATAIDAKMRGYRVRVYQDGVADIPGISGGSYFTLSQLRKNFKIEIV